MSDNPYQTFPAPRGPQFAGDLFDPAERRTSVMAVVALVLGVLGCLTACVPGPGAFALVFGGLALFFIGRSRGRLTGVGLAVTAIVLGLLSSLACTAVWIGARGGVALHDTFSAGPATSFFRSLEAGDHKAARTLLSPAADAAVTDKALDDFSAAVRADLGKVAGPPSNPLGLMETWLAVGDAFQHLNRGGLPSVPAMVRFEKGPALVGVTPAHAVNADTVTGIVVNVLVITNDGKVRALLQPAEVNAIVSSISPAGSSPLAAPGNGPGTPAPSPQDPPSPTPAPTPAPAPPPSSPPSPAPPAQPPSSEPDPAPGP